MIAARSPSWLIWLGMLSLASCSPSSSPELPPAAATATPTDLRVDLDAVLDYTLQQRRLNTADHGAWQILHGLLAFQQPFPVQLGPEGPSQSAHRPGLIDSGNSRYSLSALRCSLYDVKYMS